MIRRSLLALGLMTMGCGAMARPRPAIEFAEGYVKYDARNGEAEIILYEYAPSEGVELTKEGFATAFGLSEFEIREVMFGQGDGPKSMRVLAKTDQFMMNAPVAQLFSGLVGEPVEVDLFKNANSMNLRLVIPEENAFYIADNNAARRLRNEKSNQILLEFDVMEPISVVFGWKQPETVMEKMDRDYQRDADVFRARHLTYYGELIAEFREKTGRYPLQGAADCQNYVHLAAPHQEKYVKGSPPFKHVVTSVEDFRAELEKGLGRDVALKFDPQKVPVGAPNFYIYMIDDETFYLAVHLYNVRPFANRLGEHYNKLEITSGSSGRPGLWNADELAANKDFARLVNAKPEKEGFFLALEEDYK